MANKPRKWEAAFLAALEETGTISQAATAARVGRQTVYDYQKTDREFSYRLEIALAGAADNLEAEARRRAVEGDQVPVYAQGKVVGHKTKKSETLLMFMIKTLRDRCDRLERERLTREKEARFEEDWDDYMKTDITLEDILIPRSKDPDPEVPAPRANTPRKPPRRRAQPVNGTKKGAESPGSEGG